MITIGLTTWNEHQSLMPEKKALTLPEYASFFPCVEVDSLYYGLKSAQQFAKWGAQVPQQFQFVFKVHKLMTLHENTEAAHLNQLFHDYRQAVQPLVRSNQLKTILFQFPPFFAVSAEHVRYLVKIRQALPQLPLTVEFRNNSWYDAKYVQQTLDLLQRLKITLTIVDEPQTPANSVPYYETMTNPELVLLRLHGRNTMGWMHQDAQWRGKRTLYRYNQTELKTFAQTVQKFQAQAKEVCVIFNNNSGGDAADNALSLQKMLKLSFSGLAPRQMGLF
ncbi:DUF72 domain-containing protein [Agrilactobacillus fermenti]|uniref:DUF72 domain-containing protein n=1 Tax=Agrilactobacillus fermenti TaxID=2586909 RepID=UPI003A5C69CB